MINFEPYLNYFLVLSKLVIKCFVVVATLPLALVVVIVVVATFSVSVV